MGCRASLRARGPMHGLGRAPRMALSPRRSNLLMMHDHKVGAAVASSTVGRYLGYFSLPWALAISMDHT